MNHLNVEELVQRAYVTCHQVSGQDGHTLVALHEVIHRALNLAFRKDSLQIRPTNNSSLLLDSQTEIRLKKYLGAGYTSTLRD